MKSERPRLSDEQLVRNARGLALAAFADPASIARLLGGSEADARALQEGAVGDFVGLMARVGQAKRGRT